MADELIRRMALASCEDKWGCAARKLCGDADAGETAPCERCAARAQSCLSAAGVDELVKALEAFTVQFADHEDCDCEYCKARAALAAHRGGA